MIRGKSFRSLLLNRFAYDWAGTPLVFMFFNLQMSDIGRSNEKGASYGLIILLFKVDQRF